MPSTYSALLGLELQQTGENSNIWGTKTNNNLNLVEDAIAAYTTVNIVAAITTLTDLDGSVDQSRSAILQFNGALVSAATIEVPQTSKIWFMKNNTSGGQNVTVKTAVGTGLVLPAGIGIFVINDGVSCFGGYGTAAQRNMGSSAQDILDVSASDARYLQTGGGPVPVSLGGTGVSAFTGALIGRGTSTTAGIVPVSLGGTGLSAITTNSIPYGAGNSFSFLAPTTGTIPTFTSSGWANRVPVLTTAYNSGNIDITAGAYVSVNHSLGALPVLLQYFVVCVSGEAGFATNDIVPAPGGMGSSIFAGSSQTQGFSLVANATALKLRFANSFVWNVPSFTNGTPTQITPANWKLVIKAYA